MKSLAKNALLIGTLALTEMEGCAHYKICETSSLQDECRKNLEAAGISDEKSNSYPLIYDEINIIFFNDQGIDGNTVRNFLNIKISDPKTIAQINNLIKNKQITVEELKQLMIELNDQSLITKAIELNINAREIKNYHKTKQNLTLKEIQVLKTKQISATLLAEYLEEKPSLTIEEIIKLNTAKIKASDINNYPNEFSGTQILDVFQVTTDTYAPIKKELAISLSKLGFNASQMDELQELKKKWKLSQLQKFFKENQNLSQEQDLIITAIRQGYFTKKLLKFDKSFSTEDKIELMDNKIKIKDTKRYFGIDTMGIKADLNNAYVISTLLSKRYSRKSVKNFFIELFRVTFDKPELIEQLTSTDKKISKRAKEEIMKQLNIHNSTILIIIF